VLSEYRGAPVCSQVQAPAGGVRDTGSGQPASAARRAAPSSVGLPSASLFPNALLRGWALPRATDQPRSTRASRADRGCAAACGRSAHGFGKRDRSVRVPCCRRRAGGVRRPQDVVWRGRARAAVALPCASAHVARVGRSGCVVSNECLKRAFRHADSTADSATFMRDVRGLGAAGRATWARLTTDLPCL